MKNECVVRVCDLHPSAQFFCLTLEGRRPTSTPLPGRSYDRLADNFVSGRLCIYLRTTGCKLVARPVMATSQKKVTYYSVPEKDPVVRN